MREKLKLRLLSAVIAIIMALTVSLLGGWYFTAMIAVIVLLAQLEFFRLVRATGAAPAMRMTIITSQGLVLIQQLRPEWAGLSFTLAGTCICFYLLFKPKVATINDIATSILGLFYCAYLPSFWILVRAHSNGLKLGLIAFACIWAADIGAYFMGKQFGKTQLSIISPKKTVEGSIAGIVGSVAIATIGSWWLDWYGLPWTGIGLGLLIGITGLLGDLTESLMKRNAGVKDSGDLIPGHGGILDRGDSYVFTAPLVFFFVELFQL
ncbi:MAG: phosphatidate cytidylyltransferase [Cyanobacteria bacterium P01_E01_bin.34]